MATSATKTKRIGLLGNTVPLRASLVALQDKLKAFKVAVPEDTTRAKKHSPFNDSPLSAEIDLIFETIAKEGDLKPYEVAFTIDTADKNNPIVRGFSGRVKLLTVLLTQLRKRAKRYGVDPSCVKLRQRTKILIAGPIDE